MPGRASQRRVNPHLTRSRTDADLRVRRVAPWSSSSRACRTSFRKNRPFTASPKPRRLGRRPSRRDHLPVPRGLQRPRGHRRRRRRGPSRSRSRTVPRQHGLARSGRPRFLRSHRGINRDGYSLRQESSPHRTRNAARRRRFISLRCRLIRRSRLTRGPTHLSHTRLSLTHHPHCRTHSPLHRCRHSRYR